MKLRLDGLLDAPRSGAPRTIDDAQVDAVIAKTLESQPMNATHRSTRAMANEMGLSQTAVSRIWRAFGLQSHRQETFKLILLKNSNNAIIPHRLFLSHRRHDGKLACSAKYSFL